MIERLRQFRAGWRARYDDWRSHQSDGQFATLRSLVILGLVVLVGGGLFRLGQPALNAWRHRQAMTQAMDYAAQHDYRNTMLALKRATELAPMDLATWRDVSEQLAELGSPQAIVARENVVRLAPGDLSLRLALVEEALRFGQLDVARTALAGVGANVREDAAFHRLAAAVAMATGESAQLDEHLAALVAAAPEDATARFNLSAMRLWDLDPSRQAAALAELERLTAVPEVRVRAALELLKQAARLRDAGRARQVVDLLLDRLKVPVADRFSLDGQPPGWSSLVSALQAAAVQDGADDVALVARWLGDVRRRSEALSWLDTLPDAVRNTPAVVRANAGLSAQAEDYDRLEPLVRAGGFGPLPADAVRLAITSRVQRVRYQDTRGRGTWEDALTACGDSVPALTALAGLAESWHDVDGGERALQEILKRQSKLRWVYAALRNTYAARGDTVKLWQLYEAWARAFPEDPDLLRSRLGLGAVLDRLTPDEVVVALRRADEPAATPLDQALAAAADWRSDRLKEAVAVIDRLPATGAIRPDLAFWCAVIWGEANRVEDARQALLQARRPGLTGEERALLDQVERKVGK